MGAMPMSRDDSSERMLQKNQIPASFEILAPIIIVVAIVVVRLHAAIRRVRDVFR